MNKEVIKNKIHVIRGLQVMLDSDLAELYGVKARRLREQVKRNKERFPINFMFQLTISEAMNLVSQNATPSKKHFGGSLPYVFTEQGVAMLSSVLRSDSAVQVSIQIINAFVTMRQFLAKNGEIFLRLDNVERKQIEYQITTDNKFNKIFSALENKQPKQGIFFEGQIFDAYSFISDLIRNANKSIILIDNYIDDSVLTLFSKRKDKIKVIIYTKEITKQLKLDLDKFNSQYQEIEIKEFKESHDRFLIIDKEVYHFGASLKDLGKKWFAFSKFNKQALKLLDKL